MLLAFADGREHQDADAVRVAAAVQKSLAMSATHTLELFNTEIQNPAVKNELAAKLQRSWCDKPVYHKPLQHP